jgi:hypothetical protein
VPSRSAAYLNVVQPLTRNITNYSRGNIRGTSLALLGRKRRTGRLKYSASARMALLATPAYKELLSTETTLTPPLPGAEGHVDSDVELVDIHRHSSEGVEVDDAYCGRKAVATQFSPTNFSSGHHRIMSTADDDGKYFKELVPLVDSVKARPEVFATGDYGVRDSALLAEKFVFDHGTSTRPCSRC